MDNLQHYMTIKAAATFLGVTPNTLRNWGDSGKVVEHRHPVNNYRLYRQHDLENLLVAIEKSALGKRNPK
jgi:DNA (cytosine-5)-methyltransferase 1